MKRKSVNRYFRRNAWKMAKELVDTGKYSSRTRKQIKKISKGE